MVVLQMPGTLDRKNVVTQGGAHSEALVLCGFLGDRCMAAQWHESSLLGAA